MLACTSAISLDTRCFHYAWSGLGCIIPGQLVGLVSIPCAWSRPAGEIDLVTFLMLGHDPLVVWTGFQHTRPARWTRVRSLCLVSTRKLDRLGYIPMLGHDPQVGWTGFQCTRQARWTRVHSLCLVLAPPARLTRVQAWSRPGGSGLWENSVPNSDVN